MEELRILDSELSLVSFIDNYESFIWTDRFDDCGDFELVLPVTTTISDSIKVDYFLQNPKSESIMVIESIEFSSSEGINTINVKGRSAESLLERRIIWGNKSFTNENIKIVLETLLNDNVINPSDNNRKINVLGLAPMDPNILPTIVSEQYEGDNLLEAVRNLCTSKEIGIKVKKENKKINLYFYKGLNRSNKQTKNTPVIFSEYFDNLINSTYYESLENYKNVALVGGEGNGTDKLYESYGSDSGLSRREIFVDASDISKKQETGTLSDADYKKQLAQKGREELVEYDNQISADSEIGDLSSTFLYGYDYKIGDVVQVIDPYQHNFSAIVTENIYSRDVSELKTYPTFSYIKSIEYKTITFEGETYAHIFHHENDNNNYLFNKDLDYTGEVKMDDRRWSKMHLLPYLDVGDSYQFLVLQQETGARELADHNSNSIFTEDGNVIIISDFKAYIFAQSISPFEATFEDTTHDKITPILNIPSNYGGVYFVYNSQSYADANAPFIFNNGVKGNWFSIGGWTTYSGGQPSYGGVIVPSTCDLYVRVRKG